MRELLIYDLQARSKKLITHVVDQGMHPICNRKLNSNIVEQNELLTCPLCKEQIEKGYIPLTDEEYYAAVKIHRHAQRRNMGNYYNWIRNVKYKWRKDKHKIVQILPFRKKVNVVRGLLNGKPFFAVYDIKQTYTYLHDMKIVRMPEFFKEEYEQFCEIKNKLLL